MTEIDKNEPKLKEIVIFEFRFVHFSAKMVESDCFCCKNTIFIWEYFIRKALIKSQKSAENPESVISQKYFCDFFGRWNNNFA